MNRSALAALLLLLALPRAASAQVAAVVPIGFDQVLGLSRCTETERQRYDLDPESESVLGRRVVAQLMVRWLVRGKPPLVYEPDTQAVTYVTRVLHVVAGAADRLREHGEASRLHPWPRLLPVQDRAAPNHGWHLVLVRDPNPFAAGLPGGWLVVSDGLVMRTGSEEQLAGVLALEVARVTRGHGTELVKEHLCRSHASVVAQLRQGQTMTQPFLLEQSAAVLVRIAMELGQPPRMVSEADAWATRMLAEAGYAPTGLARYLGRIRADPLFQVPGLKLPVPLESRIEAMEAQVAAEKLAEPDAAAVELRNRRFVEALVEGGLRPDWRPALDGSPAPAATP